MPAPIDLTRLARAVHLEPSRIGNGEWLVRGGSRSHVVNADATECDCPDSTYHQDECKHRLCVRLHQGDASVVRALRALVVNPAAKRPHPHLNIV